MRTAITFLCLLAVSFPVTLANAQRTLQDGCSVTYGASDITTAGKICQVPDSAVIKEIGIIADAGTPSMTLQRFRQNGNTTVDLTSSALTSGSSGAYACSRASGDTASMNGTTTCGSTLQNISLSKGDWIQLKTGGLASTAALITI